MNTQLLALALLNGLAVASLPAAANVIDFGAVAPETAVCSSTNDGLGAITACADSDYLHQSYGDIAGVVDVRYSAPRSADTSLRWWAEDYNDLYGVAWADRSDNDSMARIDIVALQGGMGITLTHFDLGAYLNTSRSTTVTITDLADNSVLYTFSGAVGMFGGFNFATPFNVNLSSTSGIRIEWADSAYNVGIDNITYAVTAVPEAETYALLLAGLGLVTAAARRKTRI